jgi:surfeit locus 1 family protein
MFRTRSNDMPTKKPLLITRGMIWGTLIVLIVAAGCVRLGFWQLDRLGQRRALNQATRQRMGLPPVQLSSAVSDSNGLIFRRARLSGDYDDAHSIIVAGRSLRGVPGVHVLTPMRIGGAAVLVNRGWMPSADAATVPIDSVREPAARGLDALLTPFPHDYGSGTQPDSFQRVWYSMDATRLQRQFPYRVLPVIAQILPHANQPRYPIRLQAPQIDEGPHLGYAIQWFSFAAIALIGWTVLMLRTRQADARQKTE